MSHPNSRNESARTRAGKSISQFFPNLYEAIEFSPMKDERGIVADAIDDTNATADHDNAQQLNIHDSHEHETVFAEEGTYIIIPSPYTIYSSTLRVANSLFHRRS